MYSRIFLDAKSYHFMQGKGWDKGYEKGYEKPYVGISDQEFGFPQHWNSCTQLIDVHIIPLHTKYPHDVLIYMYTCARIFSYAMQDRLVSVSQSKIWKPNNLPSTLLSTWLFSVPIFVLDTFNRASSKGSHRQSSHLSEHFCNVAFWSQMHKTIEVRQWIFYSMLRGNILRFWPLCPEHVSVVPTKHCCWMFWIEASMLEENAWWLIPRELMLLWNFSFSSFLQCLYAVHFFFRR